MEVVGCAGDVCFWHHRLVHGPGINCSGRGGAPPRVRTLVPVDYQPAGLRYIDRADSNPGPNHQARAAPSESHRTEAQWAARRPPLPLVAPHS